jgi:hypothetical protein
MSSSKTPESLSALLHPAITLTTAAFAHLRRARRSRVPPQSDRVGPRLSGLPGSLSLQPAKLLASLSDPETFTSGLPVGRSPSPPPDITTVAAGQPPPTGLSPAGTVTSLAAPQVPGRPLRTCPVLRSRWGMRLRPRRSASPVAHRRILSPSTPGEVSAPTSSLFRNPISRPARSLSTLRDHGRPCTSLRSRKTRFRRGGLRRRRWDFHPGSRFEISGCYMPSFPTRLFLAHTRSTSTSPIGCLVEGSPNFRASSILARMGGAAIARHGCEPNTWNSQSE